MLKPTRRKLVNSMSHSTSVHNGFSARKLCLAALFAALACAGTSIAIPLPVGYFNLGDIFVLCAAWILGPVLGYAAAAIGTALADVILGYLVYAPATFVVKGCMALAAALLLPVFLSILKKDFPARLITAIIGEAIMVGGYFLFEATFMGCGIGAAASIPGNTLQAACGVIGATALMRLLMTNRAIRGYLN